MTRIIVAGAAMLLAGVAMAQQPAPAPAPTQSISKSLGVVVFPAKGQAAQQQAAAQQQQQRETFNKGFSACLQAMGYTVD